MRLLKISATGLPLFKDTVEIDFMAMQRVMKDKNEMITEVAPKIYTNNILSFVGINASGKTSTLKVISFVIQMMNNKPINSIDCKEILKGLKKDNAAFFDIIFTNKSNIYNLKTKIVENTNRDEIDKPFIIQSETIYVKSIKSIKSKTSIFNFEDKKIYLERKESEAFLLDDVSIIIALNKETKSSIIFFDLIDWTDFNALRILGEFPMELVKFLDPSIEHIKFNHIDDEERDIDIRLKFHNKDELSLNSIVEFNKYLSSGTVKGINVFIPALSVLQNGGYFIIDEIENHFNISIVSTLIKLFTDSSVNISGATIIFSTHYLEIIDELERNDSINFVKNTGGIESTNLSTLLARDDKKRSQYLQSGILEKSMPSYNSYILFKRAVKNRYKTKDGGSHGV